MRALALGAVLLAVALVLPTARAQAPLQTLEPPDLGASAVFGIEVAAVPDTDGDGRADLLVGAYSTNVNGVGRVGRAHLYSGGTGALLRSLDSPNPRQDGLFGFSVAGVPDADGDGRGDLLVGAVHELVGGINPGRAYLFSGATGTLLRSPTSPNGRLLGEFGHAVVGLPDVNGDGRGDLLVGASREDIGNAAQSGRAYVFSGATGTLLRTLTRPTAQGSALFGYSVAAIPDVDGDGTGDLIVASGFDDVPLTNMGRAYLFSGATGAFLRSLESPSPELNGYFGETVAGVPDVNGDGRGDLLIGAQAEDGGAPGAGRAYVFSGSDGALLRTLTSPTFEQTGIFGEAVAGVPDVDGDGVGDLLIGAALENGGASDAGRVHLFSGASGAHLGSLQSPNPRTAEQLGNFGDAVAGVPDVDGDGRGDLLVGAPREFGGPPVTGRAYLFSGATGTLLRTIESPNAAPSDNFGASVAGVPDTDGDGRSDLLVGARFEDAGDTSTGRAYLFSGSSGTLLRTLSSPSAEFIGSFGDSVAGVTDVDGDGRGDLLVGARGEDGGANDAGRAYLFSGASGALLRTIVSPDAESAGYFGYSVSGVPDADGDGRGDVLVGARAENGGANDAGRAYLFSTSTIPTAAEPPVVPAAFALSASPNPARGATTLSFALDRPGPVRLAVYDALGREVAVLADGPLGAGAHAAMLDGGRLLPGLYLARLMTPGGSAARPIVVH